MKNVRKFCDSPAYYWLIALFICYSFAVALLTTDRFSWRFLTNEGGSMLPLIQPHALVLIKQEHDASYEVGDVVAYMSHLDADKPIIVTHRLIGIGGNVYVAKGDNNQSADSEIIIPRRIIGRTVVIIPYIGALIKTTKTPLGSLIFFILPAAYFISQEVRRVLRLTKKSTRT